MNSGWWLLGGPAALLLLYYIRPWRRIGQLAYAVAAGLILIGGFNLAGPYLGLSVPLNAVTVTLVGLLGLPGLAALILLQFLV